MSTYLWVDLIILFIPFLFSFERRISFYRRWPAVLGAILVISPIYVVWDSLATNRGDWAFSPAHTMGLRVAGLPLEEILFFVVVPYSCLFIYESLRYYLPEKTIPVSKVLIVFVSGVAFGAAFLFREQFYTATVLVFLGLILGAMGLFELPELKSRRYWFFILVSYLPFIIFNYFLTAYPVVTYSPEAIWGGRFFTIPWEDFIYSYTLLSAYLFVYQRLIKKETPR